MVTWCFGYQEGNCFVLCIVAKKSLLLSSLLSGLGYIRLRDINTRLVSVFTECLPDSIHSLLSISFSILTLPSSKDKYVGQDLAKLNHQRCALEGDFDTPVSLFSSLPGCHGLLLATGPTAMGQSDHTLKCPRGWSKVNLSLFTVDLPRQIFVTVIRYWVTQFPFSLKYMTFSLQDKLGEVVQAKWSYSN